MPILDLRNAVSVAGSEDSSITVEDGRITHVGDGRGEVIDCSGLALFPGFIDVHIHGAIGIDVNDADADQLLELGKFLATKGVTAWMPTLVPDSDENYRQVIAAIDRLTEIQHSAPAAQAVGVHYEGVFANEKMCGALRPQYFKRASAGVDSIPRLKRGVHMTTFAPEIADGVELTRDLVRKGWVASIGHTRADVETLDRAFAAGAKHLTHFFNAMTGLHHRDVGVVGWALANPDVTFDIIADGIHVHPAMLDFACRTKTPASVSLISDAVAPAGLGDGNYRIWGENVRVEEGRTRSERGSIAGSVITMHDAVRRMRGLGFTDEEVALMASSNPARLLGIDATHGSIQEGKRADIVGLNANGDIRLTVIGGKVVFDAR